MEMHRRGLKAALNNAGSSPTPRFVSPCVFCPRGLLVFLSGDIAAIAWLFGSPPHFLRLRRPLSRAIFLLFNFIFYGGHMTDEHN